MMWVSNPSETQKEQSLILHPLPCLLRVVSSCVLRCHWCRIIAREAVEVDEWRKCFNSMAIKFCTPDYVVWMTQNSDIVCSSEGARGREGVWSLDVLWRRDETRCCWFFVVKRLLPFTWKRSKGTHRMKWMNELFVSSILLQKVRRSLAVVVDEHDVGMTTFVGGCCACYCDTYWRNPRSISSEWWDNLVRNWLAENEEKKSFLLIQKKKLKKRNFLILK